MNAGAEQLTQGSILLQQLLPPVLENIESLVGCSLSIDPDHPGRVYKDPLPATDTVVSFLVSGDLDGQLIILFPFAASLYLSGRMLGSQQSFPLSKLALSALQELGNIITSGLVIECDQQLALRCRLNPPTKLAELPTGPGKVIFNDITASIDEATFQVCLALFPVD